MRFASQDYEREKRWADEMPTLMVGDAVWLQQKNGHKFLGLYTERRTNRAAPSSSPTAAAGARTSSSTARCARALAEMGYTTLSIQLPVLPSTAILGDSTCRSIPDARERFQLAVDFLKRGLQEHRHRLAQPRRDHGEPVPDPPDPSVDAWVFIGIITHQSII